MEQAFRYRFYPTPEQETLLRRTMGCARLVYNRALAARTEAWYERQERVQYEETSSMLTSWKKQEDLQFLNEVSCVPLQQGLRHLQKAFANFFSGRARYPNFKKRHNGGAAEFTRSAFSWKNGKVFLAKCKEALQIQWSRPLPEGCSPSTITVKLDPRGRWHVSLLVDNPNIQPLPACDKSVGLDVGVTSLLTTSGGDKIANPRHFKRHRRKLKRVQKSLSRKKKGSNNRAKARVKVARAHGKIADSREDFLHKLTTQLVRENQTIVVEDLSVKNMVKRKVYGEALPPVKLCKKNPKLALGISDASWGELVRQLDYKCEWYGRTLVKIDRWFPSSKRCGNCGYIVESLPLDVREWDCPKCRTHHDRDINAARNLLAVGHTVEVCGANIRPDRHELKGQLRKTCKGRKQKP